MVSNRNFFESDYDIGFGNGIKVVKFDSHRFYKYVSGIGFKGVDFIALDPKRRIILIEVKNYRGGITPSDEILQATFYEKCEDSLHLLEIIQQYYERKWWVRFCYKRAPFLMNQEVKFWLDCFQLYTNGHVLLLGHYDS